jgi:hypothetical protein
MAGLNANKLPKAGSGGMKTQDAIDAGTYPARVVSILDLGLQPQRPYQGQDKPPKHEIRATYELVDEFCVGDDGVELEDKPRWISEDFPFNSLSADLAKSTKRYLALDPTQKLGGDFTLLVGMPCMVTVVNKEGAGKNVGRVFNNVGAVSGMRPKEAAKAAPLVNPTKVFVLDDPDLEVFRSLPEFLQDKIKGNLEYNGSVLQKLLQGGEGKSPEPEQDVPEDEGEGATPAQADEDEGEW